MFRSGLYSVLKYRYVFLKCVKYEMLGGNSVQEQNAPKCQNNSSHDSHRLYSIHYIQTIKLLLTHKDRFLKTRVFLLI
jgi:hypothetical protein